jgi:hypothetical protein
MPDAIGDELLQRAGDGAVFDREEDRRVRPQAPTPANFPRVDNATQRERDDVRKRVLREELATEVRLLNESETILKQGSTPLPDETVTSPKYIDRIARLRQTVDNHTKNVQALNRELERVR